MKKNIFINSFLFFIFVSTNTFAKETYFDLSQNEIMIETNFDGKEIIIFGLLEDNHDTILTIKGPKKKLKLQKKDRYFGVWFNTKRITYSNVPNIFFLASSNKIENILPESKLIQENLSFDGILRNKNYNQNFAFENDQDIWIENFIRIKKEKLFFSKFEMKKFKDKLFQTSVFFPATTTPGNYTVSVYHVRNNTIMSKEDKIIKVKKSGIGNEIYKFANNNSAAYGFFTIVFAILSGLIAATLFRRL
ncbi:TIGR02186 family protein [Pelagibacteraceae bacterium]|nr:TIGR02186 family protein [Pelagibacteraceae bacterium]